jgi:hypothetical protein
MVDAVDFTVEAPSASIAEQKIMNCYPDVASCNIELIESEGNKLKYFVVINACVCVAAYFLLKPYQNNLTNWSGILGTLVNAAGWFYGAFTVGVFIYCINVYGIFGLNFKRQDDVRSVEKEYSYRLGYKDDWTECERKGEPRFIHWAELDSRDIEPKLGPAKKLSGQKL